jgi:hypothetical protein
LGHKLPDGHHGLDLAGPYGGNTRAPVTCRIAFVTAALQTAPAGVTGAPPSSLRRRRPIRVAEHQGMPSAQVGGLPLLVRMHPGATKPFSVADEASLKQRRPTLPVYQTTGFDHVSPTQGDLPPIPQCRHSRHGEPGSNAMAEVVTVLCVFFSISIFLAHAVDAFRARSLRS